MKNKNILTVLSLIVVAVLIFSWYQHQNREDRVTPIATTTSTQSSSMSEVDQQYAADLAKVNPNCAKYYDTVGQGPDPITTELSDFTNLHPLSDFLCGKYSMVNKKIQPDGKTLYLVAIESSTDCGQGGCTTQAFLEEKPGLVLHVRSLSGWYDHNLNLISTE